MGTSVNEIPVWDETERRILHRCYIWNTCVPRTVSHPPPPPGKAWASTVVAACCGDGGPSHPTPRGGLFSSRGWSQKSALHCRFAEMMFWKVEWLRTSWLSPLLWNSDTERLQNNKKVLLTCRVHMLSARESPACHTPELWYFTLSNFRTIFLRGLSPCRQKPQTIRK